MGNFVTCCCGGEGCFNTELTGPGTIYLQSLSYEKLIRLLVKKAGGGKKKDEGMQLGGPPMSTQRSGLLVYNPNTNEEFRPLGPDWSRAELLLNRAESRAAALCDASAELPSGGQSAESAAERVRRAALPLRRSAAGRRRRGARRLPRRDRATEAGRRTRQAVGRQAAH